MQSPPRVMAIHDLSGIGKCSLTVILPILSAMGVEVAALPTAILSTHTGDIEGYTYRDLTQDLLPVARHWQSLGLSFDAIYSGWLGSAAQSRMVLEIFSMFASKDTLRVVDPVMGDHGTLYSTYTEDRVADMRALCARADLITPNLTEASFLLSIPYREGVMEERAILSLCERLVELGPPEVVVTGVSTGEGTLGAASYDARRGDFSLHQQPRVSGRFYGTGDIFCAALLGGLFADKQLSGAAALATAFAHGCIARTVALHKDPRFGVDFEHGLPTLMMEATKDESAPG